MTPKCLTIWEAVPDSIHAVVKLPANKLTPEDMVGVATHRLSVAQPGLMITPIPRAHATVEMKRRLLSIPSFIRTCITVVVSDLSCSFCTVHVVRQKQMHFARKHAMMFPHV